MESLSKTAVAKLLNSMREEVENDENKRNNLAEVQYILNFDITIEDKGIINSEPTSDENSILREVNMGSDTVRYTSKKDT